MTATEVRRTFGLRSPEGTVLDPWRHLRDGVVDEVAVGGWLNCASRDKVLQAVLLGRGVGRFADLSVWSLVRDGSAPPAATASPAMSAVSREAA